MSKENTNKVCCETDDALACAEKSMENFRKHLRDVMKPAEKAAKELENDTATRRLSRSGICMWSLYG